MRPRVLQLGQATQLLAAGATVGALRNLPHVFAEGSVLDLGAMAGSLVRLAPADEQIKEDAKVGK